ncbi:hypothetical protein GC096_11260 [Paenibacillus sp. LMG 31461]|uniref:DUF2523 domain-containing protein n=1 Tax=Paenibacillus plantarum TaxID=2654975 RepID=A0ABX1X820_9BACL|nr:hypothetical protein [Paenibacillus plantarum]NOU64608.1 hypothetical protein [Paenibacillus plantarum]
MKIIQYKYSGILSVHAFVRVSESMALFGFTSLNYLSSLVERFLGPLSKINHNYLYYPYSIEAGVSVLMTFRLLTKITPIQGAALWIKSKARG